MLVFGTAITNDQIYERRALPGIRSAAEGDSVVLERRGMSLQAAYNSMLDEAAQLRGLEALVLPHQDTQLRDPRFADKVRAALRDPAVGLVGAAGGRGIRSMLWSTGEFRGGWSGADAEVEREVRFRHPVGAVDAADGLLLVLSPWAVGELRFDPRFARWFHGYDVDFSLQVRARGRRVVVIDVDVVHWVSRRQLASHEDWIAASLAFHEKWDLDDRAQHAITEPIAAIDRTGARWRKAGTPGDR